jgi:hypothetical protein
MDHTRGRVRGDVGSRRWSLLSNHGVVLLFLAAQPGSTVRAISDDLGITERHVVRIVRDLVDAGMLDVRKVGARNAYRVRAAAPLRHPVFTRARVRDLVDLLVPRMTTTATAGVAAKRGRPLTSAQTTQARASASRPRSRRPADTR